MRIDKPTLNKGIYDISNSVGLAGSILSSTGAGISWIAPSTGTGTIAGSIADRQVAFGNGSNAIAGISTFVYTGIGSVGIGTAIPTQFLHVQGATRFNGGIYDSNNQIGLAGSVLSSTGSGVAWTAAATGSGSIGGSISDRQIAFGNGTNAIAGISTFIYTGLGSVGVGTAAPLSRLHIRGDLSDVFMAHQSGYVGINTSLRSNADPETLYVYQETDSTSYTLIRGVGNVNNYSQLVLRNNNTGNNASVDIVAEANNASESGNFINMGINNTSYSQAGAFGGPLDAYFYSTTENLYIGNQTSTIGQILFFTGNSTFWTSVTRMVITGLGSVGIGTMTPSQNLQVQGSVRITGGIYDSNNQIGLARSVMVSTGTGIAWTDNPRTINFIFGDGVNGITSGLAGYLPSCPFAGVIQSWSLISDQPGNITIDIWKDTSVPTIADTIISSGYPSLSGQQINSSSSLGGWTTVVNLGDLFAFSVSTANTVTRVTLVLRVL